MNAAASPTVYVADGAGSGTWSKLPTQSLAGISGDGVSNQSVIVDGAGSHVVTWSVARGACYFINVASPQAVTYPSVYTKIAPTTVLGGSPKDFTEGTNARVTYTGLRNRRAIITAKACASHAAGADRDLRIAIHKNGTIVANSETIETCTSAQKRQFTSVVEVACVTNDYFEVFIKNDGASGDVNVYMLELLVNAELD